MTKPTKPTGPVKVSKTKVARAAAIDILKRAGQPMPVNVLIEKVMGVKAVRDAGVPRGTVSAQIAFELQEEAPRIVRCGRATYRHVDASEGTPQ